MAIQLTKKPNKVNLAGNPIKVEITNTDGIVSSPGVKGKFSITTGLTAQDGDSFELRFGTNSLVFYFKENPDDSNFQLPLSSGMDIGEYLIAIHSILIRNYYLAKFYDFNPQSYEIALNAKYIGDQYNLALYNEIGNNVSLNTTILGSPIVYKTNYQLLLQTYVIIDDEKKLISEDLASTDTDGKVSLEISELLKIFFKSDFIFPERPGLDLLTKKSNSVVAFQFTIGEKYDGIIRNLTPIDETFFAINGGVSTEDLKFYNTYNTNYFDFSNNKSRFLTWQPDNKIVTKSQPEKLFFFTGELMSMLFTCKVYYSDGTDHSFNLIEASDVQQYSIYEMPAGVETLELEKIFPEKKIVKYEITPVGATTEIIQQYTDVIEIQSLNTGWDGDSGMLPVGSRDPRWLAGLGDASGLASVQSMIAAYVSIPDPGWITSPFSNATWISLYANSYHSGDKDCFFLLPFMIENTDPSELVINLHFYADNSVHEIYINGYPQSVNFPDKIPQAPSNPYNYYGFNNQGVQVNLELKNNWKLGGNNIVVWIKSSAPKVGFLSQGLSVSKKTEPEPPEIIHTYDKILSKRTYHFDSKEYEGHKCFLFRNSFDKWDTLRCTGERISSVDIDRTSANIINEFIGSHQNDIFVEYERKFKANTGWTNRLSKDPKAFINYLIEFLRSPEIYEVKGDILVPVKLISVKADLHKLKEYVYNLLFEYIYTSKEEFYSDEIGIEDIKFLMDDNGNPTTDDNGTPLFN